eukprot:TRINITY_DN687_c0_g1_i2.p2 TRINITY_DN687_c0_g1~~TRINITY_DN687_c0_g1_i2.p2  ORF type:complete len:238 (-),score=110.47 TRINITY_DN687_c0_g1_i2:17-730(-)
MCIRDRYQRRVHGISIMQKATNCAKGHPLEWCLDASGYTSGQYKCDCCGKSGSCTAGRFFCKFCKYDMCLDCESRDPKAKCLKGHDLKWSCSGEGYTANKFACDACKLGGRKCGPGRWNCKECHYDVCQICRPDASATFNPFKECPAKHELKWSCSAMGYPAPQFTCAKCSKDGKIGPGRFTCSECKYDICQECRPAPQAFYFLTWELPTFTRPNNCLLYTSPSPRDLSTSRMPSSA